jgi:hypothetical protein
MRRTLVLVTLLTAAALAGCNKSPDQVAAGAGSGASASPSSSGGATAHEITINKTVWYQGLKLTIQSASVQPPVQPGSASHVDVTVAVQNNVPYQINLSNVAASLTVDGQATSGGVPDQKMMAGGASGTEHLIFNTEKPVVDLATGSLLIGNGNEAQPAIPFGAQGQLVALEPQAVLNSPQEAKFPQITFAVSACELRGDFPADHKQAAKGKRLVQCAITLRNTGGSIYCGASEFGLKEPDGNVATAKYTGFVGRFELTAGEKEDVVVAWEVSWPLSGSYSVALSYLGQQGTDSRSATNTKLGPVTIH